MLFLIRKSCFFLPCWPRGRISFILRDAPCRSAIFRMTAVLMLLFQHLELPVHTAAIGFDLNKITAGCQASDIDTRAGL